jgi:large subunit ribosomal protein L11e
VVWLWFSQTYPSGSLGDHLTSQTLLTSKSRYTIRKFSITPTEKIAVHITIRGPKAEILERGLRSTGSSA